MEYDVGKTIGPYTVFEKLGAGGMGSVYKARDPRTNGYVALKVLRSDAATYQHKERFLREARLGSNLRHPNIVKVFDVGRDGDLDFILMEYVEGNPLNTVIPKSGMPYRQAVDFAIQIARGIEAAHEAGIIHRDLKPANMIVDRTGRLKILDFGLAKITENSDYDGSTHAASLTLQGGLLGTIGYMSPEQARGEEVDRRTDVFAFGVIVYQMLTSSLPFRAPNPVAMLTAMQIDPPQTIRATHPAVPAGLEQLVFRTLQKKPGARFQTIGEIIPVLEQVLTQPEYVAGMLASAAGASSSVGASQSSAAAQPGAATQSGNGGQSVFRPPTIGSERTSLVVLPLKSLSSDPDDSYMATGISEDIMRGLTGVPGLRLVPQVAAYRFQDDASNLREIALALNTRYVLSGSFRRAGNRVRVVVQLSDAIQEAVLWSKSYGRAFEDIFAVQEDISRSIVRSIGGELIRAEVNSFLRVPPDNLDAWGLMRKAYHIWNYSFSVGGVHEALTLLHRAVAIDPDYAAAHAYLGLYLIQSVIHRIAADPEAAAREALQAAQRAVQLSHDDPEVLAPSSVVFTHCEMYEQAVSCLRRAVKAAPFDLVSWGYLGFAHACAGDSSQLAEGYDILIRLIEDAPDHPSIAYWLQFASIASLRRGLINEAEKHGRKCFELQPGFVFNQVFLAEALCRLGRISEARKVLATIASYNPAYSLAVFEDVARKTCRKQEYVDQLCGMIKSLGIYV